MLGLRLLRRLAAPALAALGLLGTASGSQAVRPEAPAAAEHPSAFFARAAEAFGAGRNEEAVVWLYVAQLRYRAHLQAHPDLDPTGDPALFASLMETVGRPINEWAWGDVDGAVAGIDRALAWDAENPDGALPPDTRRTAREGLLAFRDDMADRADEIRRERAANGLANR